MAPSSTRSIAIIGAGPAGLTLARLLIVSLASLPTDIPRPSITIYELDPSPASRASQGGTLDLHPDSGLAALKKMGLWDEAFPFLRYEGEELVFADKHGTQLVHMVQAPKVEGYDARPEIDRVILQRVLLTSVTGQEETGVEVKWGRKVRRMDEEKGVLVFEDGLEEGPFDLVVGADGAWSKVRQLLTDVRPHYSGVCGFEGHIDEPAKRYPEVSKMVGRGSYFAYSDGKGITAQRMDDNSIKLGLWVKEEEGYAARLMGKAPVDEEKVREKVLKIFEDWVPEMRAWIKVCTRFKPWVLWELPVGHTWEHRKGFTLIGDAAHLCTPFAGLGVNAAMKDALELTELIIESLSRGESGLDDAAKKYEGSMFPRAKHVQEHTMMNKIHMFREDAPVGTLVAFVGFAGKESGWSLDKGWLRWVPIRKMAWSYFWLVTTFGSLRRKVKQMLFKR